nr:MAG TPA: hypothetical protein [Caudoviricetes sp.]
MLCNSMTERLGVMCLQVYQLINEVISPTDMRTESLKSMLMEI